MAAAAHSDGKEKQAGLTILDDKQAAALSAAYSAEHHMTLRHPTWSRYGFAILRVGSPSTDGADWAEACRSDHAEWAQHAVLSGLDRSTMHLEVPRTEGQPETTAEVRIDTTKPNSAEAAEAYIAHNRRYLVGLRVAAHVAGYALAWVQPRKLTDPFCAIAAAAAAAAAASTPRPPPPPAQAAGPATTARTVRAAFVANGIVA